MACIFCRSLAWLQHKLDVRAQNEAAQAHNAAHTKRINHIRWYSPHRRQYELPLIPPGENLETLRARIPLRSRIVNEQDVFHPPGPTETMEQAYWAAANAVQYPIYVAATKPERDLVAARTVQAVATAISTSPSYPVLVAVLTMAESVALIMSEEQYTNPPPGIVARRRLDALNAAVDAGMAAYAKDCSRPPDGDDINGFDPQASINSDVDSESTLLNPPPYTMQSSGNHSSPGRRCQRPISRPSASQHTYKHTSQ